MSLAAQDAKPLLASCKNAYQKESSSNALALCNDAKQKAITSDDVEQNLAITRILIKINIKLANHDLIEGLFHDAKSLVTSTNEHHEILRDHGAYYYYLGRYDHAELYFVEGLELAKQLLPAKNIAKSLNDVGLIHLRKLNYKEALNYLHQSLKIKESLQLEHHSAVTVRNIALVYYRLNDNNQALKFYLDALKRYQKALQLYPNNTALPDRIIHINTELAALYSRLGKNELSKGILQKIHLAIESLENEQLKISRYIDLAEGLIEGNDFELAKDFLHRSKELLPDSNEGNHSRLFYLLGKAEYETNDMVKALTYTNTSIEMAEKYVDNLVLLKVYKLRSTIEEKLGYMRNALSSFKKHSSINQENNKQKYNDDLRQIKFRLEAELNEKLLLERDNALLVSDAKNQKLTLTLYTVSFLISLMILSFFHIIRLNTQKRKQLSIELQMHKAKLKELNKPLINFSQLFADIQEKILICNDVGFLIYDNIGSLQLPSNKNIKEVSAELNSELECSINSGSRITTKISKKLPFSPDSQFITITPFMNLDYFIFEFQSGESPSINISGKITLANQFSQSISHLAVDNKDIGALRPIIVETMRGCLDTWVRVTNTNKVEFAEQSKIWKVNIDEGRLRTRSLDKYLSLDTLPKQPRLKIIIKTCHFLLSLEDLTKFEREAIESNLANILAFDKS